MKGEVAEVIQFLITAMIKFFHGILKSLEVMGF